MKKILLIIVIIIIVFVALATGPYNTSKENAIKITGTIKSVSEGGVHDLVFEMDNNKITYYINRGLENGFELEKAKAHYTGKQAIINYAKKWTILAPFGTTSKHIVQITIDGKEIYSEWN